MRQKWEKIFATYITEYELICGTYKEIWQINENMIRKLNRKMDEKIEQVSYKNMNFINNLGNTNEDHNIISFYIY